MTLYDVIQHISECYAVDVYDLNEIKIATYDGRDAIGPKYNGLPISEIMPDGRKIVIVLDCFMEG